MLSKLMHSFKYVDECLSVDIYEKALIGTLSAALAQATVCRKAVK